MAQLEVDMGNKNEEVALSVLLRICEYLNCDIGDICEAIHTDK